MEIGWIDFSEKDKQKVLEVLQNLDSGARDELGVGVIRDGFADLFFPGTTTLHTKAKYFILVPLACYQLENELYFNTKKYRVSLEVRNKLRELEEKQCQTLFDNHVKNGLIGRDSLQGRSTSKRNSWVKITPADIYWGGLKRFEILIKDVSMNQYIKAILKDAKEKGRKGFEKQSWKREDTDDIDYRDDENADYDRKLHFWDFPFYDKEISLTSLELAKEEAEFLKEQILKTTKGSLLEWFLREEENWNLIKKISDRNSKNRLEDEDNTAMLLDENTTFDVMEKIIYARLPEKLQYYYKLAKDFSDFFYLIQVRYNMIYTDGQNESIVKEWERVSRPEYLAIVNKVAIEEIFNLLHLRDYSLKIFLTDCKKILQSDKQGLRRIENINKLDERIQQREKDKKGVENSKLLKPNLIAGWTGLAKLSYRADQGINLLKDIIGNIV